MSRILAAKNTLANRPLKIRRSEDVGHIAVYECESRSREGVTHRPSIDFVDENVDCDCEDFEFRKNAFEKTGDFVQVSHTASHCIHVQAMINDCVKRGDIVLYCPQSKPIFKN